MPDDTAKREDEENWYGIEGSTTGSELPSALSESSLNRVREANRDERREDQPVECRHCGKEIGSLDDQVNAEYVLFVDGLETQGLANWHLGCAPQALKPFR
jgi:hypothetical protein